MDKIEYLLVCLIEECSEIQQAATKALRFGLESNHPDKISTNKEDIEKEYCHLAAIIELLAENRIISTKCCLKEFIDKKSQVIDYWDVKNKKQSDINLKPCNCGGKGVLMIWSASPTVFVKCDRCGKTTGDYTRDVTEWAVKAASRAWNKLMTKQQSNQ